MFLPGSRCVVLLVGFALAVAMVVQLVYGSVARCCCSSGASRCLVEHLISWVFVVGELPVYCCGLCFREVLLDCLISCSGEWWAAEGGNRLVPFLKRKKTWKRICQKKKKKGKGKCDDGSQKVDSADESSDEEEEGGDEDTGGGKSNDGSGSGSTGKVKDDGGQGSSKKKNGGGGTGKEGNKSKEKTVQSY
eukprot:g57064.t1